MSASPDAMLVWGLPIESVIGHDTETYEPIMHPLWLLDDSGDSEDGYWMSKSELGERGLERLEIVSYGHYEDPDSDKAVLTLRDSYRVRGDAWTPGVVDTDMLSNGPGFDGQDGIRHKDIVKATDCLRGEGIENIDLRDGRWLLVASYG